MGTRIDVELTSVREDGSWTWRAAGARQPKGALDGALLYPGAKVGDLVRAEAEFEVDGITVLSVLPPKERKRSEPERLEILAPAGEAALVTSSLVSGRDRRDRGEGRAARGARDAKASDRERPRRGGSRERSRPADGRQAGRSRPTAGRSERAAPASGSRRQPRSAGRPRDAARIEASNGQAPPGRQQRARPKRFNPPSVRRAALLAELEPEERIIAEQLLRGGLPAVRQAVRDQDAASRAAGRPAVGGEPLVAVAERLLPRVREADWLDRAEEASKNIDEISIRDLRSVVVGADVARDDASRLLASTLREAMDRRIAERRDEWARGVASALDEGRVVRSLRDAARPPDATARLSAELAGRLRDSASASLTADAAPDRWLAVLDAVVSSPVRRVVKPSGLPEDAPPELLDAARRHAGQVPGLAPLLGIKMPPPPGPPKGRLGGSRKLDAQSGDGRKAPPRPVRAEPASEGAEPAESGSSDAGLAAH